jgi:hypothetical protein
VWDQYGNVFHIRKCTKEMTSRNLPPHLSYPHSMDAGEPGYICIVVIY